MAGANPNGDDICGLGGDVKNHDMKRLRQWTTSNEQPLPLHFNSWHKKIKRPTKSMELFPDAKWVSASIASFHEANRGESCSTCLLFSSSYIRCGIFHDVCAPILRYKHNLSLDAHFSRKMQCFQGGGGECDQSSGSNVIGFFNLCML